MSHGTSPRRLAVPGRYQGQPVSGSVSTKKSKHQTLSRGEQLRVVARVGERMSRTNFREALTRPACGSRRDVPPRGFRGHPFDSSEKLGAADARPEVEVSPTQVPLTVQRVLSTVRTA